MTSEISCFKAYDVRGRIPTELNQEVAFKIGVAIASYFSTQSVVIGYDVRPSSLEILDALAKGIQSQQSEVMSIGLCGTEEIYFATNYLDSDAGVMITASHNPADYNGLKIVGAGAKPVSMDSGLGEIKSIAESVSYDDSIDLKLKEINIRDQYLDKILSFVNTESIKPLHVVTNAGNGCAGPVINALESRLPVTFTKIQNEPDGLFPNGIPNPLLVENRQVTSKAVIEHEADLGIAWDGDFDRCFFFDANGQFIENYYLIGLLSEQLLQANPKDHIVHDPRLVWNTREEVMRANGIPNQSKAGHSFIKEIMRANKAVYGGEMSGHHYFRDFYYSDSGMIPWLLLLEKISNAGQTLTDLVSERIERYPVSGEINTEVKNPKILLEKIKEHYLPFDPIIDDIDGYSFEFSDWRFNLRMSNTEPLVRLNVESRANKTLMQKKTEEILKLINRLN
ncbi:MAG: phosphomannomutase [Gammaproteobacteria bacterium]|nr:phosphomannomutase [Gammaproteobacteria bacterium]